MKCIPTQDIMSRKLKVQGSSRMSKTKMRCITCGKWFQSANAREVTCPDCTQKARKEKLATKNAPPPVSKTATSGTPSTSTPHVVNPPKPKTNKGGTNQWLDSLSDVKIGEPETPPQRPKIPSPPVQRNHNGPAGPNRYSEQQQKNYQTRSNRPTGTMRGPADHHVSNDAGYQPTMGQPNTLAQRQPMSGGPNRSGQGGYSGGNKPWQKNAAHGPQKGKPRPPKANKPAPPPRPKREKIPPPEPFKPTEEQIKQVENRYLELAQPTEFDGIRSQIAKEIGIPKKTVKKIVKELRGRQEIPSWWELQTYKGTTEELSTIKSAYEPFLPVPPVGVHKNLAEKLDLKPGVVYQAIKTIRLELNLPQYNDPTLHAQELALSDDKGNNSSSVAVATETRTESTEEEHAEGKPTEG
jgi:hypothetical protein